MGSYRSGIATLAVFALASCYTDTQALDVAVGQDNAAGGCGCRVRLPIGC